MDIEAIVAWALPSFLLLLWAVLLAFLLPRLLVRVIGPGRMLTLAVAGLFAGLFAVGLWLWANAAPLPEQARAFVIDELEPWFWGTVVFVAFVVGALLFLRRGLRFLIGRASRTDSSIDDMLIASLRRPAHVLILFAGFVLWVGLVPAPAAVTSSVYLVGEVVLIVVIALFLDGLLIDVIERRRESSRVFATAGTVLRAMARIVLFVVAALMVLGTIGIAITPIVASLGVGSLAIGLALQSTLEDFIAGLLIAADQPVTIGDFIELGDRNLSGTVDIIGWRTTRILTLERTKVIVPNSALSRATIINRSRPSPVLRFQAEIGVHYDSDLNKVARVVHEVASLIQANHPFATHDFNPVVTFFNFGASSIDLKVWLEATDWVHHFLVHDAFIRAIHDRFRVEGIVIPYPIRTLDVPVEVRQALERLGR